MKGYVTSYIVGSLLIAVAFVFLFVDVRLTPAKTKQASWALFLAGSAFVVVGWIQQNRAAGNMKNNRR
jgi:hypothetical protein